VLRRVAALKPGMAIYKGHVNLEDLALLSASDV
jgi:hypothetical protein